MELTLLPMIDVVDGLNRSLQITGLKSGSSRTIFCKTRQNGINPLAILHYRDSELKYHDQNGTVHNGMLDFLGGGRSSWGTTRIRILFARAL